MADVNSFDKLPSFAEVLDRYGLTLLKQWSPPNSPTFRPGAVVALHALASSYRFLEPALRHLFAGISSAAGRVVTLEAEQRALIRAGVMGGPDWNSKLAEMFAVSTAANACAGAVVVSLSDLIQRYKQDLKRYGRGAGATKDEWASSGECFHSHPAGQAAVTYSVGQVIVAAANQFRHSDEWDRDKGKPNGTKQLPSIEAIAAALDKPINPGAVGHGLGRKDVPVEVLRKLGWDIEPVSAKTFDFAHELAERMLARTQGGGPSAGRSESKLP